MSYVIKPTTGTHFKVQKTVYVDGKAKRQAVPRLAWPELGFNPEMTISEAKERASRLNKELWLQKREREKVVGAARRVELEKVVDSVFIPASIGEPFVHYLKVNFLDRQKSKTKLLSHWQKAQEIILCLKMLPKDFHPNKNAIVGYFQKNEYSLDYAKKIIRVMNLWGQFYSEKQGMFFRPVPRLDTFDVQSVNDAYIDSESFVGASEAITPADLKILKHNLSSEQFNWMSFSVWFGLRPSEINRLMESKKPAQVTFENINRKQVPVLVVYQEKLVRIQRDRRYKRIPAFLDEQRAVLQILEKNEPIKQPLVKTLKKYLGKKVGLYGGRKGFTDLMLSHGQSIEDISSWLGHTSIDMTWKVYKDRKKVSFRDVG